MKWERWNVELKVLTGVHIGTGLELSPLDYVMLPTKTGGAFLRIDQDRFINSLSDNEKKQFVQLLEENDLQRINKFYRAERIMKDKARYYLAEPSSEFFAEFREYRKGEKKDLNQMSVQEMIASGGTFNPYIPGSSLKGVIRTAVLARLQKDAQVKEDRNPKMLEGKILGNLNQRGFPDLEKDPFRFLAVEDCRIEGDRSRAVLSLHNLPSAKGISIRSEVIRGKLLGGDAKGNFTITVKERPKHLDGKLLFDDIAYDLYDFFSDGLKYEIDNHYNEQVRSRDSYSSISKVIQEMNGIDINKGECLIRVGKYSQGQSVTIPVEGAKDNPWGNPGKTRTLALMNGSYYPMGWCKLKFTKIDVDGRNPEVKKTEPGQIKKTAVVRRRS
jgi:CRISPR-associated protein Csm5